MTVRDPWHEPLAQLLTLHRWTRLPNSAPACTCGEWVGHDRLRASRHFADHVADAILAAGYLNEP